jgi:hypothetical protein
LSLYHQDGTVCPTIHETRQTGHGADEVKICLTTQEAICTADQQVVKLARQLDIDAEVARNTKELLYKRIHTIGARVDGALASRNHAALAVNRLRVAVLGLAGDIALGHFEDLLHPLTPKQICDMMMEIIGVDALPEPGTVFISEVVFIEDNPWDGRTRHGVSLSLEDALKTLEDFGAVDDPLIATKCDEAHAGRGEPENAWMVHRRSEIPREDGTLWIFEEKIG